MAHAGLYLHVPFCSAVCPYCDFAVHIGNAAARETFAEQLINELSLWSDWELPIDTVYFGGGTPTALSVTQLQRILDAASDALPLQADYRLHLEANPEDVTPDAAAAWKTMGVHMLSLGIQSFDDAQLRQLGRRHNGDAARRALATCLDAGIHTVSCDLMFGLPDQTRATLEANLTTVAAHAPQHLSCYQLTIHEGTPFWKWRERGRLTELDEDSQAELYLTLFETLEAQGLRAYEVSNFARGAAHESTHNRKYWHHVPYLGVGPSAHSFSGNRRWWNHRSTQNWAADVTSARKPIADEEALSDTDLALETVMLRLRTRDGLDLRAYEARFGVDLRAKNSILIDDLSARGLVKMNHSHLVPTRAGLAVADGIVALFEI